MPNIRSKEKSRLGIWIDSDLKKRLVEISEESHLTTTESVVLALEDYLQRDRAQKGKNAGDGKTGK